MPDGKAFRPGDILTGMTGKTAEIISTDAEGRLILADALAYAARLEPTAVVDLATLTGAIGTALGKHVRAGLFSNDETLQKKLMAAAEATGERLWPFPMDEAYAKPIKSDMAEVKNSAATGGGVSSKRQVHRAFHGRIPVGASGHRKYGAGGQPYQRGDAEGSNRVRSAAAGRSGGTELMVIRHRVLRRGCGALV